MKKRESPDFRSPEVGISALVTSPNNEEGKRYIFKVGLTFESVKEDHETRNNLKF